MESLLQHTESMLQHTASTCHMIFHSTRLGKGRVLAHASRLHEQHAAAVHRACDVGAEPTLLKCE